MTENRAEVGPPQPRPLPPPLEHEPPRPPLCAPRAAPRRCGRLRRRGAARGRRPRLESGRGGVVAQPLGRLRGPHGCDLVGICRYRRNVARSGWGRWGVSSCIGRPQEVDWRAAGEGREGLGSQSPNRRSELAFGPKMAPRARPFARKPVWGVPGRPGPASSRKVEPVAPIFIQMRALSADFGAALGDPPSGLRAPPRRPPDRPPTERQP